MNSHSHSSRTKAAPVKILLVEDNKIDARLTCHALSRIPDWPSAVQVVDDGQKALHFLRRQGSFEKVEQPDLVILDLNLPKYDGAEVLQVIRASVDLRELLVFIFSSSPIDVAEERMRNAQVKADFYFEKPNEVGSFYSVAAKMRDIYRSVRIERRGATA